MPWRKYKPTPGKHSPVYYIARGVQVKCNARGKWAIFLERGGERKSKSIGSGREGLVKAIKAAEKIASQINLMPYEKVEQPKAPRFKDYSKNWLKNNTGRWNEYTFIRYEGILRLYLWPNNILKGKRLDGITRTDVKTLLRLLLENLSPASVALVHTVICSIFQEAIDDGIVPANPASGLLKKLLPPKRMRNVNEADPFDIEERDRFLKYAEKYTWTEQLILKIMVHAGFRLGEVLAMRIKNLDLKKMNYYVCQSYKQYKFGLPKKGKKRFVDLPRFLSEELNDYIAHLRKESFKMGHELDLLFPDPQEDGYWPYSQRKVQMLVKRVCRGAKLRIRNPHDLRHTYATILLMANKTPAYIKEQLGHSSIMMTVDIYGHWMPGKGREGLEEALLGVQQSQTLVVRQSQTIANKSKTASVTN